MPRKLENRTFIENQLRVFITNKKAAPTTRLRAIQTLIALCGFPTVPAKEIEQDEPEAVPVAPAMADNVTKMLEQAAKDRKRGGANANKLSEGSH